ncbi:MAG: ABC transporter permease [Bacteroidota bacterium]
MLAIVDSEFFNVFDFKETGFKWISGNPKKAFAEPFNIVITQAMAKKYFGDNDPLGKPLKLEGQLDMKVTGVITDLPPNSDLPFTLLISYPTLYELEGDKMKDDWNSINNDHQAFVTLPETVSVEEAEAQFYKAHSLHVDKKTADAREICFAASVGNAQECSTRQLQPAKRG